MGDDKKKIFPLKKKEISADKPSLSLKKKPRLFFYTTPVHYGSKPSHFETSKIHFPTTEGVSERASERVSAVERASEESRVGQAQ